MVLGLGTDLLFSTEELIPSFIFVVNLIVLVINLLFIYLLVLVAVCILSENILLHVNNFICFVLDILTSSFGIYFLNTGGITINSNNKAKSIKLVLDKTSKIKLTGDSYVSSLDDSDTSYSNIDFNDYKLYVNGKAIN